MVSFRDAMWPQFSAGRLAWKDFYADEVHPNDAGHLVAATSPVRLAMRASMRGPISSPSWNAKT
jgi:hypothetical protein